MRPNPHLVIFGSWRASISSYSGFSSRDTAPLSPLDLLFSDSRMTTSIVTLTNCRLINPHRMQGLSHCCFNLSLG